MSGVLLAGCGKTEPVAAKSATQNATASSGQQRQVQTPANRFQNRGNRPGMR